MIGFNLVIACLVLTLLYCVQVFFKSVLLKLILITYLFFVSSAIYFSFDTYKGWPSNETIERGIVVYAMVEEPTQTTKGAIYLWVIPKQDDLSWWEHIFTYIEDSGAPRAYRMPYNEIAADKVNRALQQISNGMIVEIEGIDTESSGTDGDPNEQSAGEDDSNSGDAEEYRVPNFKIIPPQQRLKKDAL